MRIQSTYFKLAVTRLVHAQRRQSQFLPSPKLSPLQFDFIRNLPGYFTCRIIYHMTQVRTKYYVYYVHFENSKSDCLKELRIAALAATIKRGRPAFLSFIFSPPLALLPYPI